MEACLDASPRASRGARLRLVRSRAARAAAASAPGAAARPAYRCEGHVRYGRYAGEYGSPIWAGWRPRADAAAVAWARAAGAAVVGKTVTTEFATRKPGPTAIRTIGHTPGGSQQWLGGGGGGFLLPPGFRHQTAGSVIRPAAFCGVVGYKPSFGLISRAGMKLAVRQPRHCRACWRAPWPIARCSPAPCRAATSATRNPAGHGRLASASAARRAGTRRGRRRWRCWRASAARWAGPAPCWWTASCRPSISSRELSCAPPTSRGADALGWELMHHREDISPALRDQLDAGRAVAPRLPYPDRLDREGPGAIAA